MAGAPDLHPSAVVHPRARLAAGVRVAPFAVIEADVEVGPGAQIEVGTVLCTGTRVGADARLGPFAVVGGRPMDTRFRGEPSGVDIGAGADLREHVTVHRATGEGERTRVGAGVMIMAGVHVGHNAVVGDGAVLTNLVLLGGHVEVGAGAVVGGATVVHQWVRIGRWAMVGGASALNADVLPFALARGNPGRHYRLNAVGLRRHGVDAERYGALQDALRALRRRQTAALDTLAAAWPDVAELRDFVAGTRRGVARFVTEG